MENRIARSGPSRSRSRSPVKTTTIPSPYRERSSERVKDKMHKSQLFHKENTSLHDTPMANTSFKDESRQRAEHMDQSTRGRSREKQPVAPPVDAEMISLMGFGGFGSTRGKHVEGSKGGGAKREKKSEYRQYMNRSKGFNRALSPGR